MEELFLVNKNTSGFSVNLSYVAICFSSTYYVLLLLLLFSSIVVNEGVSDTAAMILVFEFSWII